jgi:hypothetical protein
MYHPLSCGSVAESTNSPALLVFGSNESPWLSPCAPGQSIRCMSGKAGHPEDPNASDEDTHAREEAHQHGQGGFRFVLGIECVEEAILEVELRGG